jgi:SHS2 domain-containing protein
VNAFKIEGHTADVRLEVSGSELPQLFESALAGMNEIMKKGFFEETNVPTKIERVELTAGDTTTLLVDFLSEALTKSHMANILFNRVEFDELTETSVRAKLHGVPVARFEQDIKAVTYHEAEVRKNNQGRYETTIVFDI